MTGRVGTSAATARGGGTVLVGTSRARKQDSEILWIVLNSTWAYLQHLRILRASPRGVDGRESQAFVSAAVSRQEQSTPHTNSMRWRLGRLLLSRNYRCDADVEQIPTQANSFKVPFGNDCGLFGVGFYGAGVFGLAENGIHGLRPFRRSLSSI